MTNTDAKYQYIKLISKFYYGRREAIAQHKLNKLPSFFDYMNMYNNRVDSLFTYVKDTLSIFSI